MTDSVFDEGVVASVEGIPANVPSSVETHRLRRHLLLSAC